VYTISIYEEKQQRQKMTTSFLRRLDWVRMESTNHLKGSYLYVGSILFHLRFSSPRQNLYRFNKAKKQGDFKKIAEMCSVYTDWFNRVTIDSY
jgi:hypothetical protein